MAAAASRQLTPGSQQMRIATSPTAKLAPAARHTGRVSLAFCRVLPMICIDAPPDFTIGGRAGPRVRRLPLRGSGGVLLDLRRTADDRPRQYGYPGVDIRPRSCVVR